MGSCVKIECPICLDDYTVSGGKVPKLLHCGHTHCHACSFKLVKDWKIRCPVCREETPIGASGVGGLKRNFALIEFGGLEAKPEGTWLWYDPLVDLDENPNPTEARSWITLVRVIAVSVPLLILLYVHLPVPSSA